MSIRTGLCSVTLRELSPEHVVRVTAGAGLESVEWGADEHVAPGDLDTARTVRKATEAAGLRVCSYGSYYRAGHDDPADFEAVVASARALGAPRIRIWAGATGSASATPEARATVADAVRRATGEAAAAGLRVALEWHGGTLTDDAESAARVLADAAEAATYWQPAEGMADEPALAGLRRVRDRVSAVHVFSWWPGNHRLRLAERADLWRAVFELLAGADVDALLEFVPGDDPDLVAAEAATLRELIGRGAA